MTGIQTAAPTKPSDLLARRMSILTFAERLEIDRTADRPSEIWSALDRVMWSRGEAEEIALTLLPQIDRELFEDVDTFMQRVGLKFNKGDESKCEYTRSILIAAFDNPQVTMFKHGHEQLLLWNRHFDRWEILGKSENSQGNRAHTVDFQKVDFNRLLLNVWIQHQPTWEAARKLLCDKIEGYDVQRTYPVDPDFNVNLGKIFGIKGSMNDAIAAYVVVLCDINEELMPIMRIQRAKLLAFPGSVFRDLKPIKPTETYKFHQGNWASVDSPDPTAEDVIRGGYTYIRNRNQFMEELANDKYIQMDMHGLTSIKGNPHTPYQHVLFLLERDVNMELIRHLGTPIDVNPA